MAKKLWKHQQYAFEKYKNREDFGLLFPTGTGKTLIAKEAVRRFSVEGRKVLFLCFNKFLYAYLQHQYPYENVTYCNIHTFITQYRTGEDLSSPQLRAAALQKIEWDEFEYDDIIE